MANFQQYITDVNPTWIGKITATIKRAMTKPNPHKTPVMPNVLNSRYSLTGLDWNTDGLSIMQTQHALLEHNRDWKLTDSQLAAILRYILCNRPMGNMMGFQPHHIMGMRRDYVNGKHGKNCPIPAPGIRRYVKSGSDDGSILIEPTTPKTKTVKKLTK